MNRSQFLSALTSRRTLRTARLISLAVITLAPIAMAYWDLHREQFGYTRMRPPEDYLRERNPAIDRLLPEGLGGTWFYEQLDGNAGLAFTQSKSIGLSPAACGSFFPGSVELHERAHLIEATLRADVARLMARVPAPARDEYAATNPGEHFAEMAAKAWEIVMPVTDVCVDAPEARLRDAEQRVPGTSGFVSWYLRQPALTNVDGRDGLTRLAEELGRPYRQPFDAIVRELESRRLPDGSFRKWQPRTIRDHLLDLRTDLRASARWADRFASFALVPSLALLTIAGR